MTADTTRFKRIHYRSWHRGCKETDLVLGDFADKGLAELSPELLDIYEKLLDENDIDIWNWLTGHEAPPGIPAIARYIARFWRTNKR